MPKKNRFSDLEDASTESAEALFTVQPGPAEQKVQEEIQQAVAAGDIQWLDTSLIDPNPYQPEDRVQRDDKFFALVESMRERGYLIEFALVARKNPENLAHLQQGFGHYRLAAAIEVGLKVPVYIKDLSDDDMLDYVLIENELRSGFSTMHLAQIFRTMEGKINPKTGFRYTYQAIGAKVGKDRGYVSERLALIEAPKDVQDFINKYPNNIRASHLLMKIEDADLRTELIGKLMAGEINGQQIPSYAAAYKNQKDRDRLAQEEYERQLAEHERQVAAATELQVSTSADTPPASADVAAAFAPSDEEHVTAPRPTLIVVPAPPPPPAPVSAEERDAAAAKLHAERSGVSEVGQIAGKLSKYAAKLRNRRPSDIEREYITAIVRDARQILDQYPESSDS